MVDERWDEASLRAAVVLPDNQKEDLVRFMDRMLAKDPVNRATVAELLQETWIRGMHGLLVEERKVRLWKNATEYVTTVSDAKTGVYEKCCLVHKYCESAEFIQNIFFV